MFYCVESDKSFQEATFDLEPVVQRLGFEVLQRHDLSEILCRKGIELDEDCQVFEVGNHRYMEKLLRIDMRFSLMLPWRIAVFTEKGATRIGLARPCGGLAELGQSAEAARILDEIVTKLIIIVAETCQA